MSWLFFVCVRFLSIVSNENSFYSFQNVELRKVVKTKKNWQHRIKTCVKRGKTLGFRFSMEAQKGTPLFWTNVLIRIRYPFLSVPSRKSR
jgi:hypothetical protein